MTNDSMNDKKKITAAVSAVMTYLQEEETAMAMQAAPQDITMPMENSFPVRPISLWGAGGRQAQMQMRNMMQLKAFHRLR
jgi:hypothetical protein